MSIKALEFYSGIGGLHRGLARSGVDAKVVAAFDWDPASCQVYESNHGKGISRRVDIGKLSANELAAFDAKLWLLSPSCQPYTVLNPNAKGAADPRAQSFLHLIEEVLPSMVADNTHPSHLLVENVAGFEGSSTRELLVDKLSDLGYKTIEILLTPLQFGIPNSRLRYYLLARLEPFAYVEPMETTKVWQNIPRPVTDINLYSSTTTQQVTPIAQTPTLLEGGYLDALSEEDVSQFAIPEKVLVKWGHLFDIVLPSSSRTCCFTRGYSHMVERAGSILQMNTEEDTTATFDNFKLEQSQDNPEAVSLLHSLQLRYFTPTELLRIFCFIPPVAHTDSSLPPMEPDLNSFIWPKLTSKKTKYRLLGNSVNVLVISRLIAYLFTTE